MQVSSNVGWALEEPITNNFRVGRDYPHASILVLHPYIFSPFDYRFSFEDPHITLFKSMTMFSGTDNILRNIPSFKLNMGNILHNNILSIDHCYGSE